VQERKKEKNRGNKEGHEREQTSDKKSYSVVSRYSASPITNNDTQTYIVDTRHNEWYYIHMSESFLTCFFSSFIRYNKCEEE
jgi:hypothetical protein